MENNNIKKLDFKRCIVDTSRSYIIENYILPYLVYKTVDNKPPKLTEQQKEILKIYSTNDTYYINKGRQTGYTTLMLSKIASEVVLSEGNECFIILSFKAHLLKSRLYDALDNIPTQLYTLSDDEMQPMKDNGNHIVSKNGCRIYFMEAPNKYYNILNENKDKNINIYLDEYLFSNNGEGAYALRLFENEFREKRVQKLFISSTPKNSTPFTYNIAKEYIEANKFYYMNPLNGIRYLNTKLYNDKRVPTKLDILANAISNLSREDAEEQMGIISKTDYLNFGLINKETTENVDELKRMKEDFDKAEEKIRWELSPVPDVKVDIAYDKNERKAVKMTDNDTGKEYTIEVYGEEYGEDMHELQGIRNIIWENNTNKLKIITKPYHKFNKETSAKGEKIIILK